MNNTYLVHYGTKGMKWGVRRYQNKDGTLTNAGKKRYSDNNDDRKSSAKNKLAKGVAIGATASLAAYAMYNPTSRKVIASMATKSAEQLKAAATNPKVKEFVRKTGEKSLKALSESSSRVGKAMTDAALLSMGTIAINKLTTRFTPDENATESEKNKNKILLDVSTAGITSLTTASRSSGPYNNKGGQGKAVGKAVTDAIGQPSRKGIDKSGSDWQNLFKDSNGNQRDADTRSVIKSLASNGYDVDQISEYLRRVDNGSITHSDIIDELNYYAGMRFVHSFIM